MGIPEGLALSKDQIEELLLSTWIMRVATVGPGSHINLTPMWFGWSGGRIYFWGRGQKIVNLRRNPECTIIVDRNEKYPELQAVLMQGRASILEDQAAEDADPHLEEIRWQFDAKYASGKLVPDQDPGRNPNSARGSRTRWVVFTPEKTVTWDNFKIPLPGA
jgi:nitroimidazol reductase NimA-like FMN-containing flavoprotein (pyridoxamine 5'-phosphate oxidase superfamily)